jgi:hypothetical protein
MVELVFLMLIMKLPILYLAGVCYWAVKAEPKQEPPEGARMLVPLTPGPHKPPRPRRRRPRPHDGPVRREARVARPVRVRPPSQ